MTIGAPACSSVPTGDGKMTFVSDNAGTPVEVVGSLTDITERKLMEEAVQALAAQEALKLSFSQFKVKADYAFIRDDVNDLVKESLDGLKRVRDIVQALKDFAHIGETEWQFADLHAGIDSTLVIANNEFKHKAIVKKEFGALPQVKCLASQLNQVFMNLIVNAAHAIQKDGVITLRTGATPDWVWIEIGDNGCGIAPEVLSRIFDPFFTTKPVGQGTGLGLSLSYSIVGKHRGRIEVASEPGCGTRFTVHLPVRPQTA
jgi:two-component system NtrC family sensor kinase